MEIGMKIMILAPGKEGHQNFLNFILRVQASVLSIVNKKIFY